MSPYLTKFELAFCLLVGLIGNSSTLPNLPDVAHAESRVIYFSNQKVEMFEVDEYVDRRDGSVTLNVADLLEKSPNRTSIDYYRIKEFNREDFKLDERSVIAYEKRSLLCEESDTNTWLLKSMTRQLDSVLNIKDIDTISIREDRTSIGPLSFMQFVAQNLDSFVYIDKSFDTKYMVDMYHFTKTFDMGDGTNLMVISCAIAHINILNNYQLSEGQSKLSQVDSSVHCQRIHIIVHNILDSEVKLEKLLVDKYKTRLTISFKLIEKLSTSGNLGIISGGIESANKFALPMQSGCGIVSKHNMLRIPAKQFSGRYRALGFEGERYVAFDEATMHLRHDFMGNSKLIYDLNRRKVVYISDTTGRIASGDSQFTDRSHCAQSPLFEAGTTDVSGLMSAASTKDILGIHNSVGLMYLGTTKLDDGTHCLVFEREVDYKQIPVLVNLNIRLKYQLDSRFFLTYYFVDELSFNTAGDLFDRSSYRSMWLKRIDLVSVNTSMKYGFLNAQLVFSDFIWALDSIGEDTRSRKSKLEHPVRTFDTGECTSVHSQTHLEFLMKQNEPGENLPDYHTRLRRPMSKSFWHEALTIEEGAIVAASRALLFPRSQINDLQVVVPHWSQSPGDRGQMFLVQAKLSRPMQYNVDSYLLGWVKTFSNLVADGRASFVSLGPGMPRYQCAMSLATRFKGAAKVFMLHCPNYGCGHLSELAHIDYIKYQSNPADAPSLSDYFHMCEIHLTKREADPGYMSYKIGTAVERALNGTKIYLDIEHVNEDSELEFGVFEANIVKVSATDGLSHDSLGSLVMNGFCYAEDTLVTSDANRTPYMMRLEFDRHQTLTQCHKACSLHPKCITYSYNRAKNICTLTDILSSHFHTDLIDGSSQPVGLSGLEADRKCDIYALNAMHLYQAGSVTMTTGAILTNTNGTLEAGDLNKCSNLCHRFELGAGYRCENFLYSPVKSICAFLDYQDRLFKLLSTLHPNEAYTRTYHNEHLIGEDQQSRVLSMVKYERDYVHHYVTRSSAELVLTDPSGDFTIGNYGDLSIQEKLTVPKSKPLYNLNPRGCLRECSIVDEACFGVNYCYQQKHGVPTESCELIHIRSPLAMRMNRGGSKLKTGAAELDPELTPLERKFYVQGESDEHTVDLKRSSCDHYYLVGDNLHLKREFIKAKGSDIMESKAIGKEDLENSEKFLSLLNRQFDLHSSRQSSVMYGRIVELVSGVLIGMLISILVTTSFISTIITTIVISIGVGWANFRFGRKTRSQSRAELNELDDIEPYSADDQVIIESIEH